MFGVASMYFNDALNTACGLALPISHNACFTLSSTASSSSIAESNNVPTTCARFDAIIYIKLLCIYSTN